VIVAGLPARLLSVKWATLAAVVAVAMKRPTVPFAVKFGEVAIPSLAVTAVACALPSAKLAPALPPTPARRCAERERDRRPRDRVAVRVEYTHRERVRVVALHRR